MPFDEIIIDSFAGGGGASTGIERALGRSPDVAINHSFAAIAMHRANHPETVHHQTDIWGLDPYEVAGGRKIGLLWASPDCKHFSRAKGGAVKDRNIRDLAWNICRYAELPVDVKPRVIAMENVEEFLTWAPLGEDGEPLEWLRGQTFKDWLKRLKQAGYKVQWRILRACDYGAPTIRRRLFLLARSDGRRIVWPKPTHGDPNSPEVKRGKLLPWRTAAECIDWSLVCPSIFDSSETIMAKHGLRTRRPLADATLGRIARGVHRYVLNSPRPFIMTMRNSAKPWQGIESPFHTVTAGGAFPSLVVPELASMVPVAHGGDARTYDLAEPMRTVTSGGGGRGEFALVQPFITYAQQGGRNRSAEDPMHTLCASPKDQNALVAATMVQTGYGERTGQAPRCLDLESPIGTQVAGGSKHALVTAFLAQHNGGMVGHDLRKPISTITQGGSYGASQQALVAASIVRHFGNSTGQGVDEPAPTDTSTPKTALMAASLLNLHGSNVDGADAAEPIRTIAAGGNHAGLVAAFLSAYYGTEQDTPLTDPMHTDTTKPRFGLVTVEIEGQTFAITDIGMRMLTPRERFRAQGFPESYEIETGIGPDGEAVKLTLAEQGSCCGNSVCPQVAQALIAANCADMVAQPSRYAAE